MGILKACDIGGSAKCFELHSQWTVRICAEFFKQGDTERNMHLPVSPFCDRETTNISESQRGFFDFIVLPLYNVVDEYFKCAKIHEEPIKEIAGNKLMWPKFDGKAFDNRNPLSHANASTLLTAYRELIST